MADNSPALIPILGDQLSPTLSCLAAADKKRDRILMCEVRDEATNVNHHKKKIAFIFSAMRHHAEALKKKGWTVEYISYDDPKNTGSFAGEVGRAVKRHKLARVVTTAASEKRVRTDQHGWEKTVGVPVTVLDDDRFICTQTEFSQWAEGRKSLRMEYFYREMRRKTGLLMVGDEPAGGQWNFDKDNRKAANDTLEMPAVFRVKPDAITKDVLALVETHFGNHFGTLDPFWFGVTAQHADKALKHFVDHALPLFGDYQDAMVEGEAFLYHSLLSFYINIGLLDPLKVCKAVEQAWQDGHAPINAAEGYIRQIIGWREYMNGIYWLHDDASAGHSYTAQNFFEADRQLPDFFWTGDTQMACLRAAIGQTRDEAYAHHIQRLMVTGLFTMLIGVDPFEVHEWYLAAYPDAYEWVEAPNVIGMSQYADGGQLGSKPYAASGAYIDRMSNYCKGCTYKVKKKVEDNACPFNSLYWDFLARHEDKLKGNPRMAQMYRTWARMKPESQKAYRDRAAWVLDHIDSL
ncbi:MAG: cryptochrome/photolyase family protein [Pseudomonadota bacterium]